ncbi:MAG TPA: response regulator [Candidatus Saccharimonadia bacterium]
MPANNPTPAEDPKAAASAASAASAPAGDGKLVLIAEDDPFISRMYQIKLESAGLRVVVKNNGRDAYEAIKSDHPNLAVLDINMPELSGLEVIGALQNDGFDFADMPVIVLTNSSELADRNTAHSYGAEYLVKAELTPREVLDMINQKLGATAKDA